MSWLDGLRHRVRTLIDPAGYERDLRDEVAHHQSLDELQGHDSAGARRRFGNETYFREESRRFTWLGTLDVLRQDATYASRSIRRTPGITAMIIVTLALGLGVNAATFAVLDRLYLRPPAGVADPDGLRRVWFEYSAERSGSGKSFISGSATHPRYRTLVGTADAPRDFAIYATDFALYMGTGAAKTRVRGVFASASYFDVLGVRPVLGRVYASAEDSLGNGAHVVVIGHRFWRTAFGADSSVTGRRVRIEGEEYTVIGVLPPEFAGLDLQATDAWFPLAAIPRTHWIVQGAEPGKPWWDGDAASGFTIVFRGAAVSHPFDQQATAAVRADNRLRSPQHGDTLMNVYTSGLLGSGPGEAGSELVMSARLAAVAMIVLIIACANVINLLLARAVSRRREIAVRLALGISRLRLVRLLTTETVLLALIAGGFATLVAWGGGSMLRSLVLPGVVWYESPLHWRVIAFALGLSAIAGLVAGIIPALQASNPTLSHSLKDGSRDSGTHRSRLRQTLMITQAALSVVLLAGAALFIRSLDNVRGLDIGYDADRLAFGSVRFEPGQRPPSALIAAEIEAIGQRMASRSGVEGVARTEMTPMQGISFYSFFWENDSSASLRGAGFPTYTSVTSEFFRTVGMRMVRGTTFESHTGAPKQVVVNEAMAARLWPGGDAIGRCIRFQKRDADCYSVVGIVENARQSYVIEDAKPMYYMPIGNLPNRTGFGTTLIVRANARALGAVSVALSSELRRAFPTADLAVKSMLAELEPEYRPWRLSATLFTSMGLLALLVAIVGIYSTVSYDVTQRTREFGIRIALGARLGNVLRQVVGEGVRVVAIGVALGIVLALATGKLIAATLYGISPRDPVTMIVVAVVLLGAAILAAATPAWRAARVDPVKAMRAD